VDRAGPSSGVREQRTLLVDTRTATRAAAAENSSMTISPTLSSRRQYSVSDPTESEMGPRKAMCPPAYEGLRARGIGQ